MLNETDDFDKLLMSNNKHVTRETTEEVNRVAENLKNTLKLDVAQSYILTNKENNKSVAIDGRNYVQEHQLGQTRYYRRI